MTLEQQPWGKTPEGTSVQLFTLRNSKGMAAKITNFGGILTELHVPDPSGKLTNVVLGFDSLAPYFKNDPYLGAPIGRVANRIAKASFSLDGNEYKLAANNGGNHLHGGVKGFNKVVWTSRPLPVAGDKAALELLYLSKDGEEGYPGNLNVLIRYTLTEANELRLDYEAATDKPTPLNLTNHAYFNLSGSGKIYDHVVTIASTHYTPTGPDLIPTGQILPVQGTPFDFTKPTPVGARIHQIKTDPVGYDLNYVLDNPTGELRFAARVSDPGSGRVMETFTTEPGVQFYTGNFLDGKLTGTGGVVFEQHSGLCLETQHYADAVHHPHFPSIILRPGHQFRSSTVYKFSAQ